MNHWPGGDEMENQCSCWRIATVPANVYRVDIGSDNCGRQLHPRSSGVFLIAPVIIGVDEKSYGYGLSRRLTDLYVVEGLK